MSSSSEHEDQHQEEEEEDARPPPNQQVINEADADTIRILVSTDNHLGYSEGDTVRGCDSFAALEEVLFLAKHYHADMVLLAGDLFHDNKPSRRTMHKTMDLFRRYCLGPNPVPIQILSDQTQNFRRGLANYEDENYSVDLPVFSIHGNHDDPTREGTDLFAALDLLDVANLVNYVGRQEQVNQIQISPILIKKGDTHLALYGLGAMRDERLNRMWRAQNVSFLRPEESSTSTSTSTSDNADTNKTWFNLFALHQNRDVGRGTKNCVHESMIPEWMDLVVWGHEHECCIEPQESVVGTFRITQPGSSVATSLSAGEAQRKQIGILDIRGQQFRLLPIPLTQIRSFVMGDISLAQQRGLDPEDPKVDQKVSKLLEEQVRVLIHEAREKTKELHEAAKVAGNPLATMMMEDDDCPLKNLVDKPDEVLVRLKVDHAGFSTVNNQRFGAKFVGQVANPTDILLFNRKKKESSSSNTNKLKGVQPIAPEDLEEMNIEDLIVEEIQKSDKKLELFDEKRVATALTDYVTKQQAQAIGDTVSNLLGKQQTRLIKRGALQNNNTNTSAVEQEEQDEENDNRNDDDEEMEEEPPARTTATSRKRGAATTTTTKRAAAKKPTARSRKPVEEDDDDDEFDEVSPPPKPRATAKRAAPAKGRRTKAVQYDDDDSDDEIEEVAPPPKSSRPRTTKQAPTQTSRRKNHHSMVQSESEEDAIEIIDDDDEELPPPPKRKPRAPTAAATSRAKKSASTSSSSQQRMSQSQLSFTAIKRSSPRRKTTTRKKKNADDDSDDDDDITPSRTSLEIDDDWGTANTETYKSK